MKDTQRATTSSKATGESTEGFTAEERAAIRERAKELKAAARRGPRPDKADGERDVLAKIAEMPVPDRAMAERIHALIKATAPVLSPKTWYGMPAYARDGKVVCFFTPAAKFKERYATFGFNADAHLDEGTMWPTSFALTELTAADEARIASILRKAAETGLAPATSLSPAVLDGAPEAALARAIARLPEVVEDAVLAEETHGVTAYVTELATTFHAFYRDARVVDASEPERSAARLALAEAARVTLANALGLLGISAPERM